jgi:precorrin-3B C17-methyltransferase
MTQPAGRLAIVGLGPGSPAWRTAEAVECLERATDLVGYAPYLDQVEAVPGQARHPFDNREELPRVRFALDLAASGRSVALLSSGDPGVFAMAAAVFEVLDASSDTERWAGVEVQVVPGVTAAQGAAARAGAPLGHDWCAISLSDNLKPWEVIERRLEAAGSADFVLALYNPISRHRPWQLSAALGILRRHRVPATPVVLGRDVSRPGELVDVVPLGELDPSQVDSRTVVLVGSSATREVTVPGAGVRVYTPRRYGRRASG